MRSSQETTNSTVEPRLRWFIRTPVISALSVVVTGTALVAAPPTFAQDKKHDRADFGPGCAPDRPAIAHHAGGVLTDSDKGEEAPIPCATNTGFRTSEISIAVTNEGTVLFQPALANETPGLPIGVLRSTDQGASWNFIDPAGAPPRTGAIDMNMWVDRDTGRIFWSNSENPSERVDHSDDDGKTWIPSSPVPMAFDHPQIFSGPPTDSMKKLMHAYPKVTYIVVAGGGTCNAGPTGFCATRISKSLDGGQTWSSPIAIPYPPECPSPGSNPVGGYGLNGVVGDGGTVYVPWTPCQHPYVAISHDGGDTWDLSRVSDAETIGWGELGLGMDRQGNLFTVWTAFSDRLPYLAISRDNGLNWSEPLMIAAPGVNEAAEPELVAGARGQVAVTYYGSKNAPLPFPPLCIVGSIGAGPPAIYSLETASMDCPPYKNETWSTYITESFNALDQAPLFWSATLNDPAEPTWYGMTPSSLRVPGQFFPVGSNALAGFVGPSSSGHVDYYSMTIALDGTPWVGFFQECPFGLSVSGNPNCPSMLTGAPTDGLFGRVGRLVRVPGGE